VANICSYNGLAMGKGDFAPSKAATANLLRANLVFTEWFTDSRYDTMDLALAEGRSRVEEWLAAIDEFERDAGGEPPDDWAREIFRMRRMCRRLEFHFWQTAPTLQQVS